jgi:hypothetical protein
MIKNIHRLLLTIFLFLLCRGNVYASFLENETDYYQEDPMVGYIHKAYARREYEWPEYAKGKITLKTNNLGFREDTDTKTDKEKGVVRILVTGDSQTDGVVNNHECFPNLLEAALNSKNQIDKFEVINGGCGYYGFDHYLLFLEKYKFLKPDIYIVAVYIGNDFLDVARILEAAGGFNRRPPEYIRTLRDCDCDGLMDQVMNQIYYFKNFPEMKAKTVQHALEVTLKISNLCRLCNIDFLAVFLPTKADVEWQTDGSRLDKIKECLGLSESDLQINQNLKDELGKVLSKNKIAYLDLSNDMRTQENGFYWKRDYHLNDRGHRFVAEKIYEKYNIYFRQLWLKRSKQDELVIK